ncbi:MAG: hypothetical protein H6642_00135 [Caldilineaceae bacterium]|nr:hypothetical protein [Caldilineaceae bacterium]
MASLFVAYVAAGALFALWLDEPHSEYDGLTEHAAVLVLVAATWPWPALRITWRVWQSLRASDNV